MEMKTFNLPEIGEKYTFFVHDSGLSVYVVPKPHRTFYATMVTDFGSSDSVFYDKDGRKIVLPDGVAHFLEHKMFENPDGKDAFEQYALYGGNANAYTSASRTAYLFSCTENFYENLGVLIDMVTHPHFTPANVLKEQGIIGEEIHMYDDNPGWQNYMGLLDCLFSEHPIKHDIAGTVESISHITPDLLYDCHRLFYNLRNMVLCVSGEIDLARLQAVLDERLTSAPDFTTRRETVTEPAALNRLFCEKKLEIAQPEFCIGVKTGANGGQREIACFNILLNLIFANTGAFFTRLYDRGDFYSFDFEYRYMRDIGFAILSGRAADPQKVFDEVKKEFETFRRNGISEADFERSRKCLYADAVIDFDSTENIADGFASYHLAGGGELYHRAVAAATHQDVEKLLADRFAEENFCLSVIRPFSERKR